jgi:hypothetical protein
MSTAVTFFDALGIEIDTKSTKTTSDIPTWLKYKNAKQGLRPLSASLYEPYRVQRIEIPTARFHGTALVESSTLASVQPPLPKYQPKLQPSIISKGLLSAEQLEAVIYAGEQHSRLFPLNIEHKHKKHYFSDKTVTFQKDEQKQKKTIRSKRETDRVIETDKEITLVRAGYFVADGTGVGKGRESAGIIMDNRNQGRTRAVWLSKSKDLINSARRDWTDIGGSDKDIQEWGKTSLDKPLKFKEGILFGTYALLRTIERAPKTAKKTETEILDKPELDLETSLTHASTPSIVTDEEETLTHLTSREDQLIACLGEDFDGVIILDEAHEAGNADPVSLEQDIATHASQQGEAVLGIQNRLPMARFVYVSATGASRVDGLTYAVRLGLWASGGSFIDRKNFIEEMDKGGTSALEMICRDLKALGRFCARTLSFEGVTYSRFVHELDSYETSLYNSYNKIWRMIRIGFHEELLHLGGAIESPIEGELPIPLPGANAGASASSFQGAAQRFYAQVLVQIKLPTAIAIAKDRLAEGKSVIFQVTHTNEAQTMRAIANKADCETLDDLEFSQRHMLKNYVKNNYPIHKYETIYKKGKDGKDPVTTCAKLLDANDEPFEDEQAIARRDKLLQNIDKLIFRDGPLEMIYDAFGEENIAEVTGRKYKIVHRKNKATHKTERITVLRGSRANEKETHDFNEGSKRVLIFSEEAGGTGRSYHADARFKNNSQRVHIPLEMSWRATSAVQAAGRTHRTNQISAPEMVFISTTVPGEKRFSSTPARRMAALGALSRGSREAADNGMFRAEDNLENKYGEEALRKLLGDMLEEKIDGIDSSVFAVQLGIRKNLNVVPNGTGYWEAKKKEGWHGGIRMTKFLNHLLQCDIDIDGGIQGKMMDALVDRIDNEVQSAITEGNYDSGVETYLADSILVKKRSTIHSDPDSDAKTELLTLAAQKMPEVLTYKHACNKLKYYETNVSTTSKAGFYIVDGVPELRIPSTVQRDDHSRPYMRRIPIQGGETVCPMSILPKTKLLDVDKAEEPWNSALFLVQPLKRTINVIHGALTPLWREMGWTNPVIYSLQTDEGERILGRIMTKPEVQQTLENIANKTAIHAIRAA